ncbi:UNVERIFIED_CONTAM: hypothetical protein Slati_2210100 [Sesamum latifolium]|uniref:DUF4283 domain-containing protein n=1 Tax=Sesamum latifolium TaxID=2727402 RepID=A0AAW2WS46_9LAMI
MDRLQLEFNIKEFLALATRVIDTGDSDALKAIADLKNKWAVKFGGDTVAPPLRPVATRPSTPFPHAIVPLRPAIRIPRLPSPERMASLLSRGNEPSPKPILTLPPQQPTMDQPTTSATPHPHVSLAAPETLVPRVLTPPMHLPNAAPSSGDIPAATPPPLSQPPTAPAVEFYIGKVLHFVPPTSQNGEVIVRPSLNIIHEGSKRREHTAVGYFLGKKSYFYHIDAFVRANWPGIKDVTATASGFFFFHFQTEVAMTEIIEGGPWLFQGQPIVLQRWQPGMALRKLKHTEVPIWIKLKHLPVEYWTEEGLSVVASGIGKPLYPDVITKACTRLDFARVCVMLNIASKLPKHIVIMAPTAEGGEIPCKVDVEYEWVPKKCITCMSLGHSASSCPMTQPSTKKSVNVFVPKVRPVNLAVRKEPSASPMGVVHTPPRVASVDGPTMNTTSGCQKVVYVTVVYGDNEVVPRRELWQELSLLASSIVDDPWLVLGDFNAVMDMSEVYGTSRDIRLAMEDFCSCIIDAGLVSLPMQGCSFTWHNCSEGHRSLWKRLDRMLVNDLWLMNWPNAYCHSLTPRTSDHSPLVLGGYSATPQAGLFRFDNFLARSPEFIPSVRNIWRHNIVGTLMYAVTRKLKALKAVFRAQRKKKGDLALNVKLAAEFLSIAQCILHTDRHNNLLLCLEACCRLILKGDKIRAVHVTTTCQNAMVMGRGSVHTGVLSENCQATCYKKDIPNQYS